MVLLIKRSLAGKQDILLSFISVYWTQGASLQFV